MSENYDLSIKELEKVYGKANSDGFGSAVFCEAIQPGANIEKIALEHYQYFVGANWTDETEPAWLTAWKNVYVRESGKEPDILTELDGITDPQAKLSIPLLTETIADAEQGKKALAEFFNHPLVNYLTVNLIGDGAAMSGIIITGAISNTKVCSVICLMD